MIEGVANAGHESVVTLPLRGPNWQVRHIEAAMDTDYGGCLALPPVLTTELGLDFRGNGHAYMDNDAVVEFDVYNVTALWDGRPRDVEADAMGSVRLASPWRVCGSWSATT